MPYCNDKFGEDLQEWLVWVRLGVAKAGRRSYYRPTLIIRGRDGEGKVRGVEVCGRVKYESFPPRRGEEEPLICKCACPSDMRRKVMCLERLQDDFLEGDF